jgi:hypothetical protein
MADDSAPRPYHAGRFTTPIGRMKFPRNSDMGIGKILYDRGYRIRPTGCEVNPTPKYPGDAILLLRLAKDRELGDVRIQWYETHWHVASFLPGIDVCLPGDTPKVEPERDEWCDSRKDADTHFIRHVIAAFRDGWRVVTKG